MLEYQPPKQMNMQFQQLNAQQFNHNIFQPNQNDRSRHYLYIQTQNMQLNHMIYMILYPPFINFKYNLILTKEYKIILYLQYRIFLFYLVFLKLIYKNMDLNYPTHHNVDIVKRLNHLDKITSKLNMTVKQMPIQDIVTQKHKQKIIKFISQDNHLKLINFLKKEIITPDKQIGIKGSNWNVIHHCAKFNSVKCMNKILKNIYQDDKQEYLSIINSQTSEGYTVLMLSAINKSNQTMMLLLKLGGSDLSLMCKNKLRAYDLAINYKNQNAIQELIVYQNRCKQQLYINQKQLMVIQQQNQEIGLCQQLSNYLMDCFICFKKDNEPDQNGIMKKINNIIKVKQVNNANVGSDSVKIGSRRDIQDYQIVWKKLSDINGQKMVLFDSIRGLDINQNQFTLQNNLIIFQVLCDKPSILRKNITKIDNSNSNSELTKYNITLYKNYSQFNIQVDETVPIVEQRQQIMFLSNKNQIWPMILQKSLAKLYDSYILLNNLNPIDALQEITGFYTKSIPISSLNKGSIVSYLHELRLKGYLIMLQANDNTQLQKQKNIINFSILSYYDKGKNPKILINCPDIMLNWKDNKDSRDLAVIKSHFNKADQSRIWISQQKIEYFFKNAIICYSKDLKARNQVKIKVKAKTIYNNQQKIVNKYAFQQNKKSIFFKFKVDKDHQDPATFQLVNVKTKKTYDLKNVSGWKNQGKQSLITNVQSQYCTQLTNIKLSIGQYMLRYEFQDQMIFKPQKSQIQENRGIRKRKKDGNLSNISERSQIQRQQSSKKKVRLNIQPVNLKELMLISWSNQPLQIQYVQQQFGSIQWLSYYRNHCINNWTCLPKSQKQYTYGTINNLTILLLHRPKTKKVYLQIQSKQLKLWQQNIIEGKLKQKQNKNLIELISDQKYYFYLVLLEKDNELKFTYQE